MTCCERYGDCNQGRDCPNRVAKVKTQYPRYVSPEPPSLGREQLKCLIQWLVYALLGWLVWGGVLFLVIK